MSRHQQREQLSAAAWEPPPWLALGALLALVTVRFAGLLRLSFYNDDYVYLDAAGRRDMADVLFHPIRVGGYFRPFSQDLHFKLGREALGLHPEPYHLLNLTLLLACVALVWLLGRRWLGPRAALLAAALFSLLPGHAVLVGWASGAQDLWALLFVLLSALLFERGRDAWSAAAFALALLSKESAAPLPAMLLWLGLAGGQPLRRAARRVLPHLVLLAAWGALYLGLRNAGTTSLAWSPEAAARLPLRFLLACAGVEGPHLWLQGLRDGLPWTVFVLALAVAMAVAVSPRGRAVAALATITGGDVIGASHAAPAQQRSPARLPAPDRRAVPAWLGWAALALVPVFAVAPHWSAYYFALPLVGVCLAMASLAARLPAAAAAALPLALLVSSQATLNEPLDPAAVGRSISWVPISRLMLGTRFAHAASRSLRSQVPRPEPHALFLFDALPSENGFITGNGPSLRLLYGDTTLSAGYVGAIDERTDLDRPLYFFLGNGHDFELRHVPLTAPLLHLFQYRKELFGQTHVAAALASYETGHLPPTAWSRWNLGYLLWESGDTAGAQTAWRAAAASLTPLATQARGPARRHAAMRGAALSDGRLRVLLEDCVRDPNDPTRLLAAAREARDRDSLLCAVLYFRVAHFSRQPQALRESHDTLARQHYTWAAQVAARAGRAAAKERGREMRGQEERGREVRGREERGAVSAGSVRRRSA